MLVTLISLNVCSDEMFLDSNCEHLLVRSVYSVFRVILLKDP